MVRFLAPLLLASQAVAWAPPVPSGWSSVWTDTFDGKANALPDSTKWNVTDEFFGYNGESETYTNKKENVQLSGSATLQLIPEYNVNGITWSSGRIESHYTFTPISGKKTRAESLLRFGNNTAAHKQGVWPAFWLLGDSGRHGTSWPECGEIDIMEELDGQLLAYGTSHCGTGCDSGTLNGYQKNVTIADYEWHTWWVEFDRTSGNWKTETITWFVDGNQFNQISGSLIGVESQWDALCHSPLYFILNVAIGGTWPGYPNANTWLGSGSMMEVAYVAVFQK
ncbi:putative Secreted glucosidase [Seiridium cardinale]